MTFDQFQQALPAVMREIKKDERNGGSSRTRDAILSGKLRFEHCDACAGEGTLPT